MVLKSYQKQINLDTLYEVSLNGAAASDQLKQNIYVNSGAVDIYTSNSATAPTYLNDMVLDATSSNLSGIVPFLVIPNYIAIVQKSGTSAEIILSGLETKSLGSIGAST